MKIASFFIALLVGALSDSAVANGSGWDFNMPPPQYPSCDHYRSGHTGKSGKGMSMSKSGKGLGTSKSSKANSKLGSGILNINYTVDGKDFYITFTSVHKDHCVGELLDSLVESGVAPLYDLKDASICLDVAGTAFELNAYNSFGEDELFFINSAESYAATLVFDPANVAQEQEEKLDEPVRRA